MSEQEQMMERIAAYLDGEMTAEERRAFEGEMESDLDLGAELEAQRKLNAALSAAAPVKAPADFRSQVMDRVMAESGGQKQEPARVESIEPLKKRGLPQVSRMYRWGQWAAAACVLVIGVSIYTKLDRDSYRSSASVESAASRTYDRTPGAPGIFAGESAELTIKMEQLEIADAEKGTSEKKPPGLGYGGYGASEKGYGYGYGAYGLPEKAGTQVRQTPIAIEPAVEPEKPKTVVTELPARTLGPVGGASGSVELAGDASAEAVSTPERIVAELAEKELKLVTSLRMEPQPVAEPPSSMANEFSLEPTAKKDQRSEIVASSPVFDMEGASPMRHEWEMAEAPNAVAPGTGDSKAKAAPYPTPTAPKPAEDWQYYGAAPAGRSSASTDEGRGPLLPPAALPRPEEEKAVAALADDGRGRDVDSQTKAWPTPLESSEWARFRGAAPRATSTPAVPGVVSGLAERKPESSGAISKKLTAGREEMLTPARAAPKPTPKPLEAKTPAPRKRKFDSKVLDRAPAGGGVIALVVYRKDSNSETKALQRAQKDVEKVLKKLKGDIKSSKLHLLADGHTMRETRIAIDADKTEDLIEKLSNRGYKYNKSADGRSFSKVLEQSVDSLDKTGKAPKSDGVSFIAKALPKKISPRTGGSASGRKAFEIGGSPGVKSFSGQRGGSSTAASFPAPQADITIRIISLP